MSYNKPILPEFYKDCKKITDEYEKICGRWEMDSQLLHVITEICELKDAIRNKKEKFGKFGSSEHMLKVEDELADVFLTAFATASYLGFNISQLNSAILKKMVEVESRVADLKEKEIPLT